VLVDAGAASVNINVVFQPQWTPHMMTEELQRTLGILPEEEEIVEEDEEPWMPPPEPKKKGLLSKIFGW
jgi:metal-sulfur cluster biosynthetic enzyme